MERTAKQLCTLKSIALKRLDSSSILREAGYRTTLAGKWHLGLLRKYGPQKSGYDHHYGIRDGSVDRFPEIDAIFTGGFSGDLADHIGGTPKASQKTDNASPSSAPEG